MFLQVSTPFKSFESNARGAFRQAMDELRRVTWSEMPPDRLARFIQKVPEVAIHIQLRATMNEASEFLSSKVGPQAAVPHDQGQALVWIENEVKATMVRPDRTPITQFATPKPAPLNSPRQARPFRYPTSEEEVFENMKKDSTQHPMVQWVLSHKTLENDLKMTQYTNNNSNSSNKNDEINIKIQNFMRSLI